MKNTFVLMILFAVCLWPYSQGGLVWDDHILLTEGVWQFDGVWSIWTQSVQGGEIATQYYRPIPMTLFALVQNVFLLHCLSLAIHLGSTLLLGCWLCRRFEETVAVLGMALFALHPIQTETLGWISCLPDILALHFALWTVYGFNKSSPLSPLSPWSPWWIGTCFCCGLLSKEVALIPVLVYVMDWYWSRHQQGEGFIFPRWGYSVVIPLILVLVLRMIMQVDTVWPHTFDSVPRTTLFTIGMGWFSWLNPFPHHPIRDVWALPLWSVLMGWAWCGWMLWRGGSLVGWLIVMGALTVSLPPVWVGYFAAERYLYMASVGFVWLTCNVISQANISNRVMQWIFGLWIVSTGMIHWNRAKIWSNDTELFAESVRVLPNSGYAWHLQGMHQIRTGQFALAFQSFATASEQSHSHHQSREFAIRSALESGLPEQAFEFAETGPKNDLSKGYLEAWLQASEAVGNSQRSQELRNALGQ